LQQFVERRTFCAFPRAGVVTIVIPVTCYIRGLTLLPVVTVTACLVLTATLVTCTLLVVVRFVIYYIDLVHWLLLLPSWITFNFFFTIADLYFGCTYLIYICLFSGLPITITFT